MYDQLLKKCLYRLNGMQELKVIKAGRPFTVI